MENSLLCPLCDKKVSYPGFHRHIFSEEHKKQIIELILKRKPFILKDIESKDHSALPYVIPNPKYPTRALKICFGCKKAYYGKGYTKNHKCDHLTKSLECLKAMVSEVATKPEVKSEDLSKLQKESDKLKNKVSELEKDNDKMIDIEQSIINLIKSYKKSPGFNDLMCICQDEQSALYDHIIGYLQDE